MAILTIRDVEKSFAHVHAVRGVSFAVERGEVFALLGPNGAGKTTLVRMLIGILRPDRGVIAYEQDGQTLPTLPAEDVGYLPEDRGLYNDIPIEKTLAYFGVLRGMSWSDAQAAAEHWLRRLDLYDRAKDKLERLSKGNQQKVQFVASIIHRPRFAILDEPFSGLDPLNQEFFLQVIRELRDQGTTIVLSAHQMQLVEKVADRFFLMSRGREVMSGTLEQLRASAGSAGRITFRLGEPADAAMLAAHPAVAKIESSSDGQVTLLLKDNAPLGELLSAVGARMNVLGVHSEPLSLHEIYVRALGPDAVLVAEAVP